MKKLSLALGLSAFAAGGVLVNAPSAMAQFLDVGSGGIAASASFTLGGVSQDIDTPSVTSVSTAIAIGKSSAVAGAAAGLFGESGTIAIAIGTGGEIDGPLITITQEDANTLGTAQGNNVGLGFIDLNAIEGDFSGGFNDFDLDFLFPF
ncbi:MAG: hypothetical protein ACXITR_12320 [Cyanobacterium sp.]